MTNYKQFYNAWRGFAKPKRQLLLEQNSKFLIDKMNPQDFLTLTTDEKVLNQLLTNPSIKEPYQAIMAKTLSLAVELQPDGFLKVVNHEGRNRSVAAMQQKSPVSVEVNVLNANITPNNIIGFRGQFKDITISMEDLKKNASNLEDTSKNEQTDPLDIGASRSFVGYRVQPLSRDANKKLGNYLEFSYNSDPKMKKLGLQGYISKLNQLYSVVDSEGKEYNFGFTQNVYIDSVTGQKKPPTGMKWINLVPHPIEVYGSEEKANELTYMVKTK